MAAQKRPLALPPQCAAERAALAIAATLRRAGYLAYLVGGAVRDRLLQRPVTDADVTTDATPDQVRRLFPRTWAVGAAFGVVIVLHEQAQVEVATFREDAGYSDGRHPDQVHFTDAEHDAQRRDFTVNALFYDPAAEELVDFVGGLADLERGVIRAIGDPADRFREDQLRTLRAVRFTARLGFCLEPATAAAIAAAAPAVTAVSAERICAELGKMLVGPRADQAFELLRTTGLLAQVLPEVAALAGVPQDPRWHPEGDVWTHTMLMLAGLRSPEPELAWGVLLHDVGKPRCTVRDADGRIGSPGHEERGARMAAAILRRLHCPALLIKQVAQMVAGHMRFSAVMQMRPATLRRLLAEPTFNAELELHRLDCAASHGRLDKYVFLLDQLAILANQPALPPPLLHGDDLLTRGWPPSRELGRVLREAQELQLSGELLDRDAALAWLDRTYPAGPTSHQEAPPLAEPPTRDPAEP